MEACLELQSMLYVLLAWYRKGEGYLQTVIIELGPVIKD